MRVGQGTDARGATAASARGSHGWCVRFSQTGGHSTAAPAYSPTDLPPLPSPPLQLLIITLPWAPLLTGPAPKLIRRRSGLECASRLELVHIEPPLFETVARSNQSCGMLQATAPSGSGSLRHSAHRRCVRRVELPPRPCAHGGLQVRNCRTATSKLRNVSRTFVSPSGSPRQLPHSEGPRWVPEHPR